MMDLLHGVLCAATALLDASEQTAYGLSLAADLGRRGEDTAPRSERSWGKMIILTICPDGCDGPNGLDGCDLKA